MLSLSSRFCVSRVAILSRDFARSASSMLALATDASFLRLAFVLSFCNALTFSCGTPAIVLIFFFGYLLDDVPVGTCTLSSIEEPRYHLIFEDFGAPMCDWPMRTKRVLVEIEAAVNYLR